MVANGRVRGRCLTLCHWLLVLARVVGEQSGVEASALPRATGGGRTRARRSECTIQAGWVPIGRDPIRTHSGLANNILLGRSAARG